MKVAPYNLQMARRLLTILTTCVILAISAPAPAAPPGVHPLDITTLHMLSESARDLSRELRVRDASSKRLRAKLIVIDPGHGGSNSGAIGVAGLREKQLTIELAYALRDAVEARFPDVRVLMTRYWDRDVDLATRIQWANKLGADLFLSLHYNAATHDRAIGYETYYLSDEAMAQMPAAGNRRGQALTAAQKRAAQTLDQTRVKAHIAAHKPLIAPHEKSKALADIVQAQLTKRLTSVDRGVKHANFAVLRGARMPAVVVEAGFLTHPEEGRAVLTYAHRDAVVTALVDAIGAFDKAMRTQPKPAPAVTKL